jgi:hypothetical protein
MLRVVLLAVHLCGFPIHIVWFQVTSQGWVRHHKKGELKQLRLRSDAEGAVDEFILKLDVIGTHGSFFFFADIEMQFHHCAHGSVLSNSLRLHFDSR